MKIHFTVSSLALCGGVRAILEIANRLSFQGYDVNITTFNDGARWFPTKVQVNSVELPNTWRYTKSFYDLRYSEFSTLYSATEKLLRTLLHFEIDPIKYLAKATPDCDVNIATHYYTATAVWKSGKGKPFYFIQDFWEQFNNPYQRKLFKSTLKLPFCFIANSNFVRDIVLEQQPNAIVYVSRVGVDGKVFYPRKNNKLSITKKPIVMAMIRGQLFKNDDLLIRSLNIINRKKPIHVFIVGSAKVFEPINKRIKAEFTYTLFEQINDSKLAELYSSSDLFLFVSQAEGFGLPPLEAMACRAPVVTTDCKGNRDYAINGYNCIIPKSFDVSEIAKLSILVLEMQQLKDQLVTGGLETVKKFTWEKTTNVFNQAFKENV